MLLLILPDRHEIGLVKQDVSRHQHRIGEQAGVDIVAVGGGFVLELSHPRQLAEHRIAVEHPRQLGMCGNMALHEKDIVFIVQSAGKIHRQQLARATSQLSRNLTHGDRMQVDHAENTIVFLLQRYPIAQRAEIIADRDLTGRLHAGKDDFFALGCIFHCLPLPSDGHAS